MQVRLSARSANDDELVADLARVAADNGSGVLTRARYDRYGAFHSSTIVRRLGGWATACSKAGLTTGRSDLGHADEVWMSNIYEVWIATGRQPSYDAMRIGTSRFSPEGYARRYGSWTQALVSFQHWIDGSEHTRPADDAKEAHVSPRGRTPNLRLRWRVLERDRFTCRGCGTSPAIVPGTILHVDHIVPFSRDGLTDIDNLQTLCDRCNLGKTNWTPSD